MDSFLPIGFSQTRIKELANLIAWIFKKHGHGEVVAISVLDKLVATLELILAFVMVQQGGGGVVSGGEIGGGIGWPSFSAATVIPG